MTDLNYNKIIFYSLLEVNSQKILPINELCIDEPIFVEEIY